MFVWQTIRNTGRTTGGIYDLATADFFWTALDQNPMTMNAQISYYTGKKSPQSNEDISKTLV